MKKINFLTLLLALTLLLGAGQVVSAQTSAQVLLTWKADSFVPATYTGKVLPNENSEVSVVLQLLVAGRPVPSDNLEIKWYVNNKIIPESANLSTLEISGSEFVASSYSVLAIVRTPAGELVNQRVEIPVSEPRLVIDMPYPDKIVGEKDVYLGAIPYFFDIQIPEEIRFSWEINDNLVAIRAQSILFDIENNSRLRILPVLISAYGEGDELITSKKITIKPR